MKSNMNSRTLFLLITLLFYTLYLIFPLFADMVRIPVWFPSLATSSLLFIMFPNAFKNNVFYWFLVYASVLIIFVMMGKPLTIGIGTVADSKKILIEFAYILPALSIFSVLYFIRDQEFTLKYVKWAIFILYLSFIVALPLMERYNSLRAALIEQGEDLKIMGLPGYSLMHAYTLLLPFCCYSLRALSGFKKIASFILLLILCFVIYDTFVTTSLIIMVGVLFFTLTYNDRRTSIYWIFIFILIFLFYFLYEMGLYIDIIDWLSPLFSDTPVEQKLQDIRISLIEGQLKGGSITGRQFHHEISWNSFLENPLWGTSIVGGHSSLLDRFGGMGIIGGVPFIMIFVSFFKRFSKIIQSKAARAFVNIGMICSFIYLYEKGLWGAESWLMLFVIMPFSIWAVDCKLSKK